MRKLFVLILSILALTTSYSYAQTQGSIQCGDILEGEVIAEQSQTVDIGYGNIITFDGYALNLDAGTRVNLTITPLGQTFNAAFVLLDSGGNGIFRQNSVSDGEAEQLLDYAIGSSNQVIRIMGARPGRVYDDDLTDTDWFYNNGSSDVFNHVGHYFGAYEIRLGCTLRDGTVIEAGESAPDNNGSGGSSSNPEPPFSGFGFPGLGSVDFSAGIELPLSLGQPQTAPIAANLVALYTYTATEGEVRTLRISRASGNLSIGVTVIKKDNNEIIFLSGMPSSNNLSVELSFPSAGDYAIGLFALNTSTLTDTSGAVTISIE